MRKAFALLDVLGALVLLLLALTVIFRFNHQLEQRLYQTGEARNQLRHAAWRLSLGDPPPDQGVADLEQRRPREWILRDGPYQYYVYAPAEVPPAWSAPQTDSE
ncbi:hypothetical protein [Acanthopleuribacter pedis]|uniref:Uncharacterized protein n=1 Tax=Acanthopleuribacter pedis TaxID=442870 RepID=A0A8J7U6E7_9BACT|nr:hypothetical protein [Acanthopleuribacter pedis]MBO1321839.1 hypothetical protein [Acanthopleuribacter pedis]